MPYFQDAYGVRVKGVYLISPSRIITLLIWMIKQVVTMKIASRIHVYLSTEALPDILPLDILPIEYGGYEKSLGSLHSKWSFIWIQLQR